MATVISFFFRVWAAMHGATAIRLIGVPRPGGFVFVTSPDLPGFSVMLRPGEHEDASSVFAVLSDPLKNFLTAECHANEPPAKKRVRVTAVRETARDSYLAELCAA